MKNRILHWFTLIAGTILSVFFTFALLFAGASFIGGLTDGSGVAIDMEWLFELLGLLTIIMIILSMILAWFKSRSGGLLLSIFAVLHILLAYNTEIAWMQISILFIGPLLIFSSSRKEKA